MVMGFGVLFINIAIVVAMFAILYFVIKAAVKNGVIEAHKKIENTVNSENSDTN